MPKKVIRRETVPHVSASMRSAFKRCRYQWSFRYMQSLEPKISAPPLRFGSLVHTAMESYYVKGVKRGVHPAVTFASAYMQELETASSMGFKDEDGVWQDALTLGTNMLEHYVDFWGSDRDWKVLATEATFEQPVVDPTTGEIIGTYIGVLDLVMLHRPTGDIWLWDHKTTRAIETGYLALDDQSSGYWTYGVDWLRQRKVLKPGQDLAGIKFNFLRKAIKDDRPQNKEGHFLNQDGTVSKVQPSKYFERFTSFRGESEREFTRLRVAAEIKEMAMVKAGTLELLKSPDKMNCKFCDVRDICELHESGADWKEMMRLIMMPRRPIIREAVEFEHEH